APSVRQPISRLLRLGAPRRGRRRRRHDPLQVVGDAPVEGGFEPVLKRHGGCADSSGAHERGNRLRKERLHADRPPAKSAGHRPPRESFACVILSPIQPDVWPRPLHLPPPPRPTAARTGAGGPATKAFSPTSSTRAPAGSAN